MHHDARSLFGCTLIAEGSSHFLIAFEHGFALVATWQDAEQGATNVGNAKAVGQQFLHDFAVGNEVNERDVTALDEMGVNPPHKMGHRRFVAHHLGHVEECGLEGGSAAGYKGCR